MGLTVFLANELGAKQADAVADPENVLHRLLPSFEDDSYDLLRYIDRYGSTVFNQLQMEQFLYEWQRIKSSVRTLEQRRVVEEVEELARRCNEGLHLYLKFAGD